MAATGTVETEIKFGAGPGFTLPDLSGVAPGVTVVEAPTLDLDAVYVDTADLRLVRRGVSLRRRTGEGAPRWTLKLPDQGTGGIALARREFDVESDEADVPPDLADLVAAWVRRTPLVPVTTIRTRRRRVVLTNNGVALAEVADDVVSVIEGDEQVAARFREIEVELTPGASPDLLTLVAGALERAGASKPDRTTKVVRALGPRALAPPDLCWDEVGPRASMADLVIAALADAARQIIDHDHVVRLDDDPEGVHLTRVGARRLRSAVSTFGPVLDPIWADGLRAELAWIATLLGAVRDTDVLLGRFWAMGQDLDESDHGAAALVVARLDTERRNHLGALLGAMRTERYLYLLEGVAAAASAPPLTPAANGRAAELAPELVRPRWTQLRRTVERLGERPSDEAQHEVRILAKRARYAAEFVAPVVGAPAKTLGHGLAVVADLLGELHDTAVAVAWLRGLVPVLSHAEAMVAGQLIAAERRRADELRRVWPAAWAACDQKSSLRWLR